MLWTHFRRKHSQVLVLTLAVVLCGIAAWPAAAGDRLQWTGAVTDVEGVSGGGIVPWALIGGLETNEQVGATGFATYVSTEDFTLRTAGASADLYDRLEVSFSRQRFDAGAVVPGLTLGQDIVGAKVRLLGDAVFAPDSFLPQIAFGAEWKRTLDFDEIPRAVGAAHGEDVDLYLAATKLYFAAVAGCNVVLDATVRRTRANQFGLLGFGSQSPGEDGYHYMPEVSAGIFLREPLLVGVEYRDKPNILGAFRENSAEDVFLAYSPVKNFSVTAAWADLGTIAGKTTQRGAYISLWMGI